MTTSQHATRIALLTAFASVLLGWLAAHTEVMYADGLRYVAGAQAVERGDWKATIARAVDHPVYPLAVAAAHCLLGGGDRPQDWQTAAQVVSVAAGVLLVVPLYLVALELYGPAVAWLACLLTYMVPITGHVLADVLSEGVFLLFWTWGCWFALRFFRHGGMPWLLATLGAAGLAYMTRPEGLLLPAALAATLGLMVVRPSIRFARPVWLRATALIVVGPLVLVGPYIALKGGIGTKPAVARLFGLAPKSTAMAIERERPLDPDQSAARAFATACRGMFRAVQGAVTTPLLALAVLGVFLRSPGRDSGQARGRLFVGVVCVAWTLALVRLYATGGYCTPRHALILALPVIAAAASALVRLSELTARRFAADATEGRRRFVQATVCGACLLIGGSLWGKATLAPVNESYAGYRQAGEWLSAHTAPGAKVLDLKGWALFYGQRPGYSFGDLGQAPGDAGLGWVVAHDAFLVGPWSYCQTVRDLVGGRTPIRSFPETRRKGVSQVHVFELSPDMARSEPSDSTTRH
ncbi:MAG: glycosyltransferase family 39 protein [Paludisphaera borealis]|uniref:ArnT family glycosyltransferase n=1 Tax=Paludisphaera borealis TaxID=1387353 RepID=UPI00284E482E|nr:glycosyltransferase family 39 protein [Paludisphaera borealis]MDR3622581.1 glycosyltransferase family 39 protein [Paludisphaera borealis]